MNDVVLVEQLLDDLELLQEHYASLETLADDVMGMLNYKLSDVQRDISQFLEKNVGPRMIQAQRSQAKTTLAAIYSVWRIIHRPQTRVLIFSAGDTQAQEIANWAIQIIMGLPELEILRPRPGTRDRSSTTAFDINGVLKGIEKSPSIACKSITANIQGARADLLIADDIESSKNARTAAGRELLKHLMKDFASICASNDILYLGTPQSVDSVYNDLPSRGYTLRVWPGRYPTHKQLPNYAGVLAPLIEERVRANPGLMTGGGLSGNLGQAVDPVIVPEAELQQKERDQGMAYFMLQYMLDTRLMDAERYPLKLSKVLFLGLNNDRGPLRVYQRNITDNLIKPPPGFPVTEVMYRAGGASDEQAAYTGRYMFVDPAGGGQNGDLTGWAVTTYIAGYVHVLGLGGVRGGYDQDILEELTDIAVRYNVGEVGVEQNFGHGAFQRIWSPVLIRRHKCTITDVHNTGQKEHRIADTLAPIVDAGKLVLDEGIIQADVDRCTRYPVELRAEHSFFYQFSRLTRDRGSLPHDDVLEALAGSCAKWVETLALDDAKIQAENQAAEWQQFIRQPGGRHAPLIPALTGGAKRWQTSMDRFTRRTLR